MGAMLLRIFTEPQQGADYTTLLRVAQATEEYGFDAFFRSDHYLKMGDVSGAPGPSDAWVTLAALARETQRVRLGTLVTAATFRLPGPLAISVANVDDMSGGRVELGLGTGWDTDEHTDYGIPFPSLRELFDRFEEQLEIITGLWETPPGKTFEFEGAHYRLAAPPALPQPVQRPPPPAPPPRGRSPSRPSGPGRRSSSAAPAPSAPRGSPPATPTSSTCRSTPWRRPRRRTSGCGRPAPTAAVRTR